MMTNNDCTTTTTSTQDAFTASTITVGNVTAPVSFVPVPNMPGYVFQYFNLHDQDMLPIVLEGARLINEAATNFSKSNSSGPIEALYTMETSTYEIAHVLRTTYSHKVHVLMKRQRADLRPSVSISYTAVTSTTPSTLFCDKRTAPRITAAMSITTPDDTIPHQNEPQQPPMRVAIFDNVVTSGGTIRAAVKLLRTQNIHVVVILVLFTEGDEAIKELEIEPGFVLPVISFGHLPLIKQ